MDSRMYPGAAKFKTLTLTPAEVATIVAAHQNHTVPGVAADDMCVACEAPATGNASGFCSARVNAANQVTLTFTNPTAGALTPAAGTFRFAFIKRPAA
jgi:hypothetical protein